MSMKKTILVYTTHPLSKEIQAAMVHQFNHPKVSPGERVERNHYNQFELAAGEATGRTVDDIITTHLEHIRALDQTNVSQVDGSLIIIADDGMKPASHPQMVLVVKIINIEYKNRGGEATERYQAVRVLASNVGLVHATIQSRKHGWEDIWRIAQANGGHFPGQ